MAFSQYSGYIPRCQHIKTNGTQCGSPALHRKRFCYFHNRWRAASINLKRASAARGASILELPVLEDADSVQVALMQVMRLILGRQLDHKTGGLILYGLQTASANLRHIEFEPVHKQDVIIDPRSVAETSVGDDAWSPDDFEEDEQEEEEEEDDDDDDDDETTVSVARAPSPAVGVTAEFNQPDELKDLQRIQAALERAKRGSLRDLKTVFKLTGIHPSRAESSSITRLEGK